MNVILNRYRGDRHDNQTRCQSCGKLRSVAQVPIFSDDRPEMKLASICVSCLLAAATAITNAVLEDAANG